MKIRKINIFGWYLRWRHGRGFGIHSPFAYRFLKWVLKEQRGYAYYGYERLPKGVGHGRKQTSRLLLRVLAALRPSTVYLPDSEAETLGKVLALACPHARREEAGEAQLCIVTADDACGCQPAPAAHLILLPPYSAVAMALWQKHLRDAKHGMSFGNRHSRALIFVANPKLPRQDFDIKF